jgi:hypothetical protein
MNRAASRVVIAVPQLHLPLGSDDVQETQAGYDDLDT